VSNKIKFRAVKQLIFLIVLIAQFFNHALIAVLMHILLVTFFQFAIGPLLLNASLLLVLTTDYSD